MNIYNNIQDNIQDMKNMGQIYTNSLINADCLEAMKYIDDKSIDMILCDLPYGITQNGKDIPISFDQLWLHYNRIIKDNGCIALFGQGLFYADLVNSNRKMFRYDLVWNKVLPSGFLNANRMPLRQHEQIAIFYKKLPTYNPQKTLGKTNHSKGKAKENANNNYGKFDFVDNSKELGNMKNPTSIFTFSKPHPSKAIHPTQKPVELLEYLIKTYTNENELVLDNCAGSMSTVIACINTNRSYIGIEKDRKYFEIGKQRVISHLKTEKIDTNI